MEYKIRNVISVDISDKNHPAKLAENPKWDVTCFIWFIKNYQNCSYQLFVFCTIFAPRGALMVDKVTYQLPSQSLTLKSAFSSLATYRSHSRQRWFETIKRDQTISQLYTKPVMNKSTLYDALFPRLFPRHEEKQGHKLLFDWEITGKLSNLATRWLQLRLDHQSNFLFCSSIYLSPMFCLRIHKKVVIGTQESWK